MGRYFEQFSVGERFVTPSRTLTESQIADFAALTGDRNPIHMDAAFAATTPFVTPIAHGPMMIGMAFGLLSDIDLIDGTALALKDLTWSFEAPLRAGDSVHVVAIVLEARPSRRHSDRGVVEFAIDVITQETVKVQSGKAVVIVRRNS